MNPIVRLTLDSPNGLFVFSGAEVPENIRFGGKQILSKHRLLGGRRVIDSMGPDDVPLAWSGIFLYNTALSRARFLDSLRRTGVLCTLSWDELRYTVKIEEFVADYRKKFHIPYRITCEVVEDKTALLDSVPAVTPAQAINQDIAQASALTSCVGDFNLSSLFASLKSAISSVTNSAQPIANGLVDISALGQVPQCAGEIFNSAKSTVASVAGPLAAFSAHVNSLILSSEKSVISVQKIGGVTVGNPVAKMIGDSTSQANAAVHLPILYELGNITGKINTNLQKISSPTSPKQVVVGGRDLYQVAVEQYGDAGRWSDIAQANGLTDPNLTGINTLIIPA